METNPPEAHVGQSDSAPFVLLVGWAVITTGVKLKPGATGTESVRLVAQPPEKGADSETCKFRASPMAVPELVGVEQHVERCAAEVTAGWRRRRAARSSSSALSPPP
jgi:hypothetical protein